MLDPRSFGVLLAQKPMNFFPEVIANWVCAECKWWGSAGRLSEALTCSWYTEFFPELQGK